MSDVLWIAVCFIACLVAWVWQWLYLRAKESAERWRALSNGWQSLAEGQIAKWEQQVEPILSAPTGAKVTVASETRAVVLEVVSVMDVEPTGGER